MKKKVFSFLLAITMISVCITTPISAEEDNGGVSLYEPSYDETLLMNLGIIDRENYNGNDIMTRGEFAVLLAKTLGLEIMESNNVSTSVPEVDDSEIIHPTSLIFKDVSVSSDEYGAIISVYENGYMVGISEDLFAPEYGIVLSDAAKVFVDMLGFYEIAKANGGYREGYKHVSSSLKLLNGVSGGFSDVATKKDIASLLCNVMETNVAEKQNGELNLSTSDDETFMVKIMDIDKVTGVITDNGLTALNGPSAIYSDQILCNNVVMNISAEESYVRKYLGRKVVAYYKINRDDEFELIFAEPKSDVIVIPKKNFVDYDKGVLKYYSENNTLKAANIGTYAGIIYNQVYTTTYTEDIFDIADGQIILIPDGNKYTVIVEDYKNFVVSKITEENLSIYNKISFANSNDGINLVMLDEYDEVCLLDEKRKPISFSSIKEDDVLSVLLSSDYKYAEVILSTNTQGDVKFTKINADRYVTETQAYDYLDVLKKASNAKPVMLGKNYMLYFNAFGNLVWIDETTFEADGVKEAILIKFLPDDEREDRFGIKVYESNDSIKIYYIEEKLKLNTSTVKAQSAFSIDDNGNKSGILYNADVLGKPILFKAEDSVIKEIITPLGYAEEDDQRGWYRINYDYLNDDRGVQYIVDDGASFGGLFSYDKADCNIYFVPPDDEKRVSVNEVDFTNYEYYKIEGYAKEKDSLVADVLVCREEVKRAESKNALLITDVYVALDDENEICTMFDGYEFNTPGIMTKKSYIVDEDAEIIFGADGSPSKTYKDLEAGDIIRFSKDVKGKIKYIAMSYDYSDDNAFNIYDSQAHTYRGYMMSINDKGFKVVIPGEETINGVKENVFYTPDELISKIQTPGATTQQVKEYATMIRSYLSGDNYPVIIVDTSQNELFFEEASLDDVFAYNDTASRYDTVVVCSHYFVSKMGLVVYR